MQSTAHPTNSSTSISTNTATSGPTVSAISNTSTSTNPATTGPAASTSSNISISTNPATSGQTTSNTSTSINPATTGSTANATNNISKVTSSTGGVDIKVIVPAVVVPGGLVVIGAIILVVVVCIKRHRAGKNVCESPDGMAVQDKGYNVAVWKQSQGHDRVADKCDAVCTTPDGFIIYPGPAAISVVGPNNEKKHHDVPHQYSRPYTVTHDYQTAYVPSTYTSARSFTHKDNKHHDVVHKYSRPYTGTSGYQSAYVPSTNMSARIYPHKNTSYDYESPYPIAASRPAYYQTSYYPQTGYYGQISQDMYHRGSGQYSYEQRSRPHNDHNARKQQREYYNQYEMADYGGIRAGYRHTKQDTAFYY